MLSDVFMEYMVTKKKEKNDYVKMALIIGAAVLLSAIVFFAIMIIIPQLSTLALLAVAGIWYGAYYLLIKFNIEYEYILTNSEIDIDMIMSKRKRKRVASFDFKSAEVVASIDDEEHNYDYKNNKQIKILDLSGDKNFAGVYFADVVINGERTLVLFRPTSRMLESIKMFNPRKVFIKE